MLERIEGLLENLRQVSSDIAHDLRTPLARLRNRLEQGIVEHSAGNGDQHLIEDAIQRVDEVLSLFAAILRIAEVEGGETRRFFVRSTSASSLTELVESYRAGDPGRGPNLVVVDRAGPAVVKAIANCSRRRRST